MTRFLTSIASVVFSASLLAGEPAVTVGYDANDARGANPVAQGWIETHDREHRAEGGVALGRGKNPRQAWRIDDDDDAGPEGLFYRAVLTDDQRDASRRKGFHFRCRLRIPGDTAGPTRAISSEVCVARRDGSGRLRIGCQMGRRGNELVASVFTGGRGFADGAITLPDAAGVHDWTLLFDGATDTLNLLVDEHVVMAAHVDNADTGHDLVFGSRSTGTGVSAWSSVAFSVGLPPGTRLVAPPEPPQEVDVFVGGEDDYFAYRIPSLLLTPKGTLLAFCEGRKSSLADLGNNDLVLKRSTDGGRTWGPLEIVYDEGDEVTIGNPTPVVDRQTGTIWLVFSRDASDVLVMHSRDDGRSWSKAADITQQVKRPEWKFYAVGPGVAVQLRHGPHAGRLVVPAYHRTTQNKSGPTIAHVFYSDDGGKSWQLGGDAGPHLCECQVAETLADGKSELLLNARNHWARSGGKPELAGRRIVARSSDGGQTWSAPEFDAALVEPTCQASLLRLSWPAGDPQANSAGRSRLLFANPASRGRNRMTVRLSYDEGRTWAASRLVYGGSAAYCCLAALPADRIGLVYEADGYKRIVLATFDLDWLTLGKDQKR